MINNNQEAKPFALYGFEKMLYDIRMGPVALIHKDIMYVAFSGSSEVSLPQPNIIAYDIKNKKWSEPVKPGVLKVYNPDHHYNPIIWMDIEEKLHMLFQCHCTPGIHLVAKNPCSIDEWVAGPEIAPNITYPRIIKLPDGRLLLYYRVLEHMGFWTYILSNDGGYSWSKPKALIDFDQNAQSQEDEWAGTYHSVTPSADGKSLHIGFVYFHERGMHNWIHPVYGIKPMVASRFHLYYVKVDIDTGRMVNLNGDVMERPINRNSADPCKIWDTGYFLDNVPAILLTGKNEEPSFLLPVSNETAYKCNFYYVFRKNGEWIKTKICATNSTWAGCNIKRAEDGKIIANMIASELDDGNKLIYGGGVPQQWSSYDGINWSMDEEFVPEEGMLFNNPIFAEYSDGKAADDYLLMFGWEGPDSLTPRLVGPAAGYKDSSASVKDEAKAIKVTNRGKAYAMYKGEWL